MAGAWSGHDERWPPKLRAPHCSSLGEAAGAQRPLKKNYKQLRRPSQHIEPRSLQRRLVQTNREDSSAPRQWRPCRGRSRVSGDRSGTAQSACQVQRRWLTCPTIGKRHFAIHLDVASPLPRLLPLSAKASDLGGTDTPPSEEKQVNKGRRDTGTDQRCLPLFGYPTTRAAARAPASAGPQLRKATPR
ncbi:hypothetical protein NDU88_003674 [Pleurodeles waltl]|uniref:Uncharacterized protein n=1 Tax=Pleurodeles waltl TaxID=8319 RepID=A0AAV7W464_PLEWA|nr:hypothetical protein NDU88_003674 [Pleurodeles waltl]